MLRLLELGAQADDWVLVHDAARPNLTRGDLDRLLEELAEDPVGGLLAVPARDTLKRSDRDGRVSETIDRSVVWLAYTPQMFPSAPCTGRWPMRWWPAWRSPTRLRRWSGPAMRRSWWKGAPTT